MTDKLRARPADQALAVSATPANAVDGPSGFDPSRWAARREQGSWPFFGNGEPICPHCAAPCSIADNEWWHLYSDDGSHSVECPSCDREFEVRSSASWSFSTDEQEEMEEEDAIAMEARSGETEGLDPKDDSAGRNGIAQ